MNNPKRVRRVTVKTERTFIFRSRPEVRTGWCRECNAEVGMKSVAGAARELGLSELELYRLVDSRTVHFSEDIEGGLMICLRSLK